MTSATLQMLVISSSEHASQTFVNIDNDTDSDSSRLSSDTAFTVVLRLMCALGIPGNVFVAVVYSQTLKTSTRVYMFALAVVDTFVCLSVIVYTDRRLGRVVKLLAFFALNASVVFSVFVLTFVAMERYVAVCRPLVFSVSVRRAKIALTVITAVTFALGTMVTIVRLFELELLYRVLCAMLVITCVVVIVVCYILLALSLIRRVRLAKVEHGIQSTQPGQADEVASTKAATASCTTSTAKSTLTLRERQQLAATKSKEAREVQARKDVLLMFVITLVFIVCWTPFQLKGLVELPVSADLKRVYTINSVVNPFIYSFISSMFRGDVRLFYRKMCAKITTCY